MGLDMDKYFLLNRLKRIVFFISPLIIVFVDIIVGYIGCLSIDMPLNRALSLNIKYYPIVFVYMKMALHYISYIWALYLFLSFYYDKIMPKWAMFKVYIIHSIIILAIALSAMIPSYLITIRILQPNEFFVYIYLPSTMLVLEIYIAIALIHALYYGLKRLIYDRINSRFKLILIVLLIYALGFIISFAAGVIALVASKPSIYIQSVISCKAPLYELEMWIKYIVPSISSILDDYFSPLMRFIFIIVIVRKLKG